MTKICSKCHKEKDTSEFYWRKENNNFRSKCKSCELENHKKYSDKNKGKIAKRAKKWYRENNAQGKSTRQAYYKSLIGRMAHWKARANKADIEWSLDLEFLESLSKVCHYTGQELTFEPNQPNSISLDRIDSSKGYTKDNVVFCSWRVNQAKNDLSKLEYFQLCKQIVDFNKL